MTQAATATVELCVSSRPVACVPTLLAPSASCIGQQRSQEASGRAQLHIPIPEASAPLQLAMPRLRQVSLFEEVAQSTCVSPELDGVVQIGQVGHRPSTYDALEEFGVSASDSLGITTLSIPGAESAADFAESVLLMDLLAVMAINADAEDHVEVYFYGFRRHIEDTSPYDILNIDDSVAAEGTVCDIASGAENLAEIQLGGNELAFFASKIASATLHYPELDLRSTTPPTENVGLGVFDSPLLG